MTEERPSDHCEVCRHLGDVEEWGDLDDSSDDSWPRLSTGHRAQPPEFDRLKRVTAFGYGSGNVLRCPLCGMFYDFEDRDWGGFYGNTTYWSAVLRRLPSFFDSRFLKDGDRTEVARRAHEYAAAGDLTGLDRALLHDPDASVRLDALAALTRLAREWFDVGPLEERLRELLADGPDLARASAGILASHWLQKDRRTDVGQLLESPRPAVRRGALEALAWEVPLSTQAYLDQVRPLLRSDDEASRTLARTVLRKHGALAPGE